MNDVDVAALIDTTRNEVRERTAHALLRFDRLARNADPHARPPRSEWTVQQVVSHVLTLARRYLEYAEGRYRLASYPDEVSLLNRTELEAAMAPIPELVDGLRALVPQLNQLFDEVADEGKGSRLSLRCLGGWHHVADELARRAAAARPRYCASCQGAVDNCRA